MGPAPPLTSTPHDFGAAPEAGVHPRLLFGAEHIEVLRERWESDAYAARIARDTLSWTRGYGRLDELIALDPETPLTEADVDALWGAIEQRGIGMYTLAVHAEVTDDEALRQEAIRAVVNFARLHLASQTFKPDHSVWSEDTWHHEVVWTFGSTGWPLAYDLLYNYLSEEERVIVQQALLAATSGRRSWGMGEPATRKFSNWAPYISGPLVVMLLAIEEVEGFDRETFEMAADNLRQYLDVSIYEGGGAFEDGYTMLGLREGSLGMVALDRRGEQNLRHPNYQAFLRHVAFGLEPSREGLYVGHSAGGGLNYPTFWAIAQAAWPDDPIANYLWRYHNGPELDRQLRWQSYISMLTFGVEGQTVDTWADTGLGLSWCDPRRGLVISRSDAHEDALYLHFDARPDGVFLGHDNADRGSFTLSALGRSFVPDDAWRAFTSSSDHSLVHIDGVAQQLKAPAVRLLEATDDGTFVIGRADLEYAYDWQWSPAWPEDNAEYSDPWEVEEADLRDLGWPADDDWLPDSLYGYADIGFSGLWTGRARNVPVTHALRSVVTSRGDTPWLLVSDDIAAEDAALHSYDWQLHLEEDLLIVQQSGDDVVLGAEGDDRRLLLRVLQADDEGAAWAASHETYSSSGEDAGRLHITADTTEASFRVLVFPHREGDVLPDTSWAEGVLTVTLGEVVDTVVVSHDGIVVSRGG